MDELLAQFRDVGVQDRSHLVQQFSAVLHIDSQTSQFFLESSNWNVEIAINTFLATAGGQGNIFQQSAAVLPEAAFLTNLAQTHAMQFPPSTRLPMTWQFHNTGQAPWPADAALVFIEGERMGGPRQMPVRADPGGVTELAVEVQTPAENGDYAGQWRLTCSTGFFSDPIWLVVNVRDDAGADLTQSLAAFQMRSNSPRDMSDVAVPGSAVAPAPQPVPAMATHAPPPAAGTAAGGFVMQPTFNFGVGAAAVAPAQPAVEAPPQQAAPLQQPQQSAAAPGGFALAQPAFNFAPGSQHHPQQQ